MKLPSLAALVRGALPAVVRWVRQPTTIGGLAALAGAAASYFTGHRDAAIIAAAGGLVGMVIPDNSAARGPAERMVIDILTAAAADKLVAASPNLIADARTLVGAFANPEPKESK